MTPIELYIEMIKVALPYVVVFGIGNMVVTTVLNAMFGKGLKF